MRQLLVGALALSSAFGSTASAHVVFAEPIASPNSYYAGFLVVGHGCGDSPTRAVRVQIPESITTARAQPKPGWTLTVEHVPLETPITTEGGNEIAERVSAITWSGHLPAAQFDQFGILLRLPDQSGPLYFPVIQTCANGEQRWEQMPADGAAWNSVARPPAMLTLRARPSDPHHH